MKVRFTLNIITPFILALVLTLHSCNTKTEKSFPVQFKMEMAWKGIAPDFRTGDVSPDGVYFTDINWDTGNLELINLETDEVKPLTGNGYDDGGYSWMSAFSNDGRQLVYAWFNNNIGTHELRLYSFRSNEFKTLVEADKEVYFIEPLDWTNNNETILVAKQYVNSNWEFGFISILDGSYQPLKELSWMAPGGKSYGAYPYAKLSPDNAFIGFDYRDPLTGESNLQIISTSTGKISDLPKADADDRFLYWKENGRKIYFYSNRNGGHAIYSLNIDKGRAKGDPLKVKDIRPGLTAIGMTAKGFAHGYSTGDFNTYYGAADFIDGRVINEAVMVDSLAFNRNNVGAWSRKGDSLLYIQFKGMPDGRESVIIQSANDGGKREIKFPWDFHHKTGKVAWTSESTILLDGASSEYSGIHQFNLHSGEISVPFDLGYKGFMRQFVATSTGSKFFIEQRGNNPGLMLMDPSEGTKQKLVEGLIIPASTCISADDKYLAYLRNDQDSKSTTIEIMNLETKELDVIVTQEQGVLKNPLAWSADGQRLIVGVNLSNGQQGLWSIDVANPSDLVFMGLPDILNSIMVISPNGKNFAYQGGTRRGALYFANSK